eukprot:5726602-Pyramimonas_sp.AAC.1
MHLDCEPGNIDTLVLKLAGSMMGPVAGVQNYDARAYVADETRRVATLADGPHGRLEDRDKSAE